MMDTKKSCRKGRYILGIVTSISSILIVLFIFEFALRIFIAEPESVFPPRYYHSVDSLAGYDIAERFPSTMHNFHDYKYLVWSNELGCFDAPFNEKKDYILLIGDSTAWGYAPFEYKFGTLIEQYLDYRVLKCGVAGYGTGQELLKLQKIVKRVGYNPRLIIVGYSIENDLTDDYLFPTYSVVDGYLVRKVKFDNTVTGKRMTYSGELLKNQAKNYRLYNVPYEPAGVFIKIKCSLSRFRIYALLRKNELIRKIFKRDGPLAFDPLSTISLKENQWLNGALEGHIGNLRKIKEFANEHNAQLLVIMIPHKELVCGGPIKNYPYLNECMEIIKNFFNDAKIFFLDLTPHFKQYVNEPLSKKFNSKKDLYWNGDGHLNIMGNKLVSILVAKYIIEHDLVKITNKGNKNTLIEYEFNNFGQ